MMIHPTFLRRSHKDPSSLKTGAIILPIIFYVIFGILLITLRDMTLSIAAYVLAGLMIFAGIFDIFAYLRAPVIRKVTESRLAIGLILILAGALLAFNPSFLHDLFPVAWGISLLFGGFLKIQFAFDQLTLNIRRWWIMLIFAAFSLLIGTLALARPGFLGENEELVIGILLIAEAVLDFVVFFLMNSALKKHASDLLPELSSHPDNNASESPEARTDPSTYNGDTTDALSVETADSPAADP